MKYLEHTFGYQTTGYEFSNKGFRSTVKNSRNSYLPRTIGEFLK